MNEDESSSLLVTIFDINSVWWSKHDHGAKEEESFLHCLESLMIFINSHLLMKHSNKLGFIVCNGDSSIFVYPDREGGLKDLASVRDGKYEEFIRLNDNIVDEVKRIYNEALEGHAIGESNKATKLSGALSQAHCYIHRLMKESTAVDKLSARILVVKASSDVAPQYMPIMNCIFAAQKNNIVIDGCVLGDDSGYLQQAADITGGNYLKVTSIAGLLQYLLWVFLPDPHTRKSLVLPSAVQIDYRGACFCHRQLVDIGFVCSVCLSIYCKFIPRCMTCQTLFKLPDLPMGSKPKKKKKQ
ncbi:general transcription factor IIH subunit 3-like [Rhopilema esculentum]|uniref:general transcription factor IIH subunit 3-like n=1 Tax=Rhopilema esculentum TaxID=499914 RepID=UPI0031DB9CB8